MNPNKRAEDGWRLTTLYCSVLVLFFTVSLRAQESNEGIEDGATQAASIEERDKWVRLQLFLDDAEFNPGKIDGRWGEFTAKALSRYYQAQGSPDKRFDETAPESLDLQMPEGDIFTKYEVTQEDAALPGKMATQPSAQAKQEELPYTSVWEALAERFHSSRTLLEELNPELKEKSLKAGEVITVPNVSKPFRFSDVKKKAEEQKKAEKQKAEKQKAEKQKAEKQKAEKQKAEEEKAEEEKAEEEKAEEQKAEAPSTLRIVITRSEKMLDLYDKDKLVACFPVTVGSGSTPAPLGDWEVTKTAWMPVFRWDRSMLEKGRRSDDAYLLPPGPNSPVGIVWMALNKDGIGLHGTNSPDTIGRASSHGCIRLSNWDAWTLGRRIPEGTPVEIK